ncbi:hypothetical protein [Virgibacillus doumboii]|uniref:hypothetical protein n=1 Tax=Virgibacillus doumboii TaxID=2697503 RepID=UPI0013DF1467|nr:hypothetical protein [Virgibacillus doumboii]
METLPNWFWIIYCLLLLTTLITAIYSFAKKKMEGFSILAIVITVTVPVVSLINSIGRTEGMNEFEHLVSQLQQGAIWSVFVVLGYLFLLLWWISFLLKVKEKMYEL